jgi:branched-chain amino acid transport system permease protein
MRRMTGEMVLAAILTTIALGILLRGVIVMIWSAAQQHPLQALHFTNPPIELIAGARISTCAALMVLMTVVVYSGLSMP